MNIIAVNNCKFGLYLSSGYAAVLAFVHALLWLTFYPYNLKLIKGLMLLPWVGVTEDKLLSVLQYVIVCGLTPLFVYFWVRVYQRDKDFLASSSIITLILCLLLSVGLLVLSAWVADFTVLPALLCMITLLLLSFHFLLPYAKN